MTETEYGLILLVAIVFLAMWFLYGQPREPRESELAKLYPRPDSKKTTLSLKKEDMRSPRFGFHALPPAKKIESQVLKNKDKSEKLFDDSSDVS